LKILGFIPSVNGNKYVSGIQFWYTLLGWKIFCLRFNDDFHIVIDDTSISYTKQVAEEMISKDIPENFDVSETAKSIYFF
jgi:hypothetical protein